VAVCIHTFLTSTFSGSEWIQSRLIHSIPWGRDSIAPLIRFESFREEKYVTTAGNLISDISVLLESLKFFSYLVTLVQFRTLCNMQGVSKKLYNFESLYKFSQRT
jgi:hypothetical protein